MEGAPGAPSLSPFRGEIVEQEPPAQLAAPEHRSGPLATPGARLLRALGTEPLIRVKNQNLGATILVMAPRAAGILEVSFRHSSTYRLLGKFIKKCFNVNSFNKAY